MSSIISSLTIYWRGGWQCCSVIQFLNSWDHVMTCLNTRSLKMRNPTTHFDILAKLKHLLAGHIFLYQALFQIVSTIFSHFHWWVCIKCEPASHASHAAHWRITEKTLIRNASVNSTCAQHPPGLLRAFTCLVSPGGGAFANFAQPGGWAFANPRAIPELLTRTRFPIRI